MTDDKPFLFCGEPRAGESSYCACHKRLSVKSDQPKGVPGGFVLPAFKPTAKRHGLRGRVNNPEGFGSGSQVAVDVRIRRSLETATILQEAAE